MEEAGILLQEQDLSLAHALHIHKGKKNHMILYFKAKKWAGDVGSCEPKKFTRTVWLPIDELSPNISEMTRTVLDHHKKGITFTCATVHTTVEIKIPIKELVY